MPLSRRLRFRFKRDPSKTLGDRPLRAASTKRRSFGTRIRTVKTRLVRRFFCFFVFFVLSRALMMNRVPCCSLALQVLRLKKNFLVKQTNTYVHTSIYGYMGAGGKRGGGAHYSVNFGFQRKKKPPSPSPPRTFPPPSNRKL